MDNLSQYKPKQQRFAPRKFREMVLYIMHECAEDPEFGLVKLSAIMYKADMDCYLATGRSITGATYIKGTEGPFPKQLPRLVGEMIARGEIVLALEAK